MNGFDDFNQNGFNTGTSTISNNDFGSTGGNTNSNQNSGGFNTQTSTTTTSTTTT